MTSSQHEGDNDNLNRSIAVAVVICLILSTLNSIVASHSWISDFSDFLFVVSLELGKPRSLLGYIVQGSVPAVFIPGFFALIFYFIKRSVHSAKIAFRTASIIMIVVVLLGGNFGRLF